MIVTSPQELNLDNQVTTWKLIRNFSIEILKIGLLGNMVPVQ